MDDGGVGDGDIEAAELRHRLVDQRLDLGLIADVAVMKEGATAGRAHAFIAIYGQGRLFALLGVDVADQNLRALAGEQLGAGKADAAGGAGDDRAFALEPHGRTFRP